MNFSKDVCVPMYCVYALRASVCVCVCVCVGGDMVKVGTVYKDTG